MKAKKSFAEEISKDFDTQPVLEAKSSTAKTKSMPGARLIPLDQIVPDPGQPRKLFEETSISELYESVLRHGVIEPITVRQDGTGYVIITGERRYRAAKKAGLSEIPCVIRQVEAEEAFACQILENVQRQDLTPAEEALAIQKLCGTVTQQEAAKVISKSQPYVSKLLSISELPEEILKDAAISKFTKEHLFQVSKASDPLKAWEAVKRGSQAKDINAKKTKAKTAKPWTWKPDTKDFKLSISFKKEYSKQDIIKALQKALASIQS